MIYFPSSKANISTEFPVAIGSTVDAEGMVLVADNTNGVFGAKMAAGGGSEVFLGISVGMVMTMLKASKVESLIQPTTHIINLAFTPTTGTIGVYDNTAGAMLAITTDWTRSGKAITLQAATDGHEIIVSYNYVPTAVQARALQGDIYPGGPAGAAIGQIGVIRNGLVYTDQFDPSVNWNTNPVVVKTAANGQLTVGGGGTTLTRVQVIAPPTAGFPYLGLLLQ